MTTMFLFAFGSLVLAFLLGLYQLWRVHRRSKARELQLALRMKQETWLQSEDD